MDYGSKFCSLHVISTQYFTPDYYTVTFDQAPVNQNSSVLIEPIIESTVQSPGYRFCTLPWKTILGHAFGILTIFSLYPTVATFSGSSFYLSSISSKGSEPEWWCSQISSAWNSMSCNKIPKNVYTLWLAIYPKIWSSNSQFFTAPKHILREFSRGLIIFYGDVKVWLIKPAIYFGLIQTPSTLDHIAIQKP